MDLNSRTPSWLPWSLWGAAIGLAAAAVGLQLASLSAPIPAQFGFRGFAAVFAVAFSTVGALVASRRPENAIGWLFLEAGLLSGIQEFVTQYGAYGAVLHPGALPLARYLTWISGWVWVPITGTIVIYLVLLFPTGRLRSDRWRPVLWLAPLAIGGFAAGMAMFPGPISNIPAVDNPFGVDSSLVNVFTGVGSLLYVFCAVSALTSLILRLREAHGDERQQLRWFISGAALALTALAASFPFAASGEIPKPLSVYVVIAFAMIPVTAGIAILRYRLYDIDIVINKAVVYGLLAAVVALDYVALVVGVGTLIGNRSSPFLSAVSAGVAALAFQPVRRRTQALANRLVYGRRATPYEVLSEFSDRLAGAYSVDDVLPRMVQIVVDGTGATRGDVWLRVGDRLRREVGWPHRQADGPSGLSVKGEDLPSFPGGVEAFAVRHSGELLGALTVVMPPSEPLNPSGRKLVENLAAQAGLVLRNVRLIAELQASRQRLVAAQDEERRRLERNIHDGAQQQLVALGLKLGLARRLVEGDVAKAGEMLEQLQQENQDALETLRDLARGIYPPLLADQGLIAALEAQARKSSVPVSVEADELGRYPQEVEAAVYFTSLEALQNVSKYAAASRVTVRLTSSNGTLAFEVADDGVGFEPSSTPSGSGLTNMADRLAAIGGSLEVRSRPGQGTVVAGRVPVAALQGSGSGR